jgi:hypothetical protein
VKQIIFHISPVRQENFTKACKIKLCLLFVSFWHSGRESQKNGVRNIRTANFSASIFLTLRVVPEETPTTKAGAWCQ